MNFLSQNDELQEQKILWEYKPYGNIINISVRYRKTDDNLIIVMQEKFVSKLIMNCNRKDDIL